MYYVGLVAIAVMTFLGCYSIFLFVNLIDGRGIGGSWAISQGRIKFEPNGQFHNVFQRLRFSIANTQFKFWAIESFEEVFDGIKLAAIARLPLWSERTGHNDAET
jgi:hypothetical protein